MASKSIINSYKPIGLTTYQLIQKIRKEYPEYKDKTLGFAGRLDPMAEGVVLILVDDENKKRKKYLGLDKEYIFEVMFGFSTDTYDTMGMVQSAGSLPEDWEKKLKSILKNYKGKIKQKFPPFSSKHIKGKALFQWATEGRLDEIEIPSVEREIYSVELTSTYTIKKSDFKKQITENISKVKGHFRQQEIIKNWKKVLAEDVRDEFFVAKVKILSSTGTYVRGLADEIGKKLGSGALALSIKRTRVGEFKEENSRFKA